MVQADKIREAKERLGESAAILIAKELPIEMFDERTLKGKSIFRDEDTPSMIWFKQGCCFKDFSSGSTYDIIDFFTKAKGKTFIQAVKDLFDLVGMEYDENELKDNSQKDFFANYHYPHDEPANDRLDVESYFMRRGISPETLDYCCVKQSEAGDCAYQFYLSDGIHVATKYRVARPAKNSEFKWYWQKGADNCPVLYGLDKVDTTKPLVVCEGLNDRLSIVEAGYYNVVSIPGGANDLNWIDFNFDFLENFNDIILWYDDDEAGKKAVKEVVARIGLYRTKVVEPTEEIKNKIREYYNKYGSNIDKVDANNVLVAAGKDAVLRLIQDAKIVESKNVRKLMEYEEISIQDIPKTQTGFKSMDKIFSGTLESTLTILTGQAGSGKSSIINTMFVAAPLENDEKVFIYSGELPPSVLLGNILKPLASNRHILRFHNEGRPDGFKVTEEAIKAMKKYYMDKLFVFDEEKNLESNSITLMDSIIYSYRRYGVKNFILDSLLTIDCSKESGDDKYEKEASFVKKLKVLTNEYPIKICLVIHTRKLAAGTKSITGDDINGSSTHNKLCDRAYSIERIYDDPEGYTTRIRCVKDRATGLIDKYVMLKYDMSSYRIYSDDEELQKSYQWEKYENINYPEKISKYIVGNERKNVQVVGDDFKEVFGDCV